MTIREQLAKAAANHAAKMQAVRDAIRLGCDLRICPPRGKRPTVTARTEQVDAMREIRAMLVA